MRNMHKNNRHMEGAGVGGGGRRGYSCIAPGHFAGNNVRHPPPSCNNGGYANGNNNNFVVTRRMEEQYSVQMMNGHDERIQKNGNDLVPRFPHEVHQPSMQHPEQDGALLPYAKNGIPQKRRSAPVSSQPPPLQEPRSSTPDTKNAYELLGYHFNMVGNLHEKVIHHQKQLEEKFSISEKNVAALQRERDIYLPQVKVLQQEKETLTQHYEESLARSCEETRNAQRESAEWRENTIGIGEQMKCLQTKASRQEKEIEFQTIKIKNMQANEENFVQIVEKLEKSEKSMMMDRDILRDKLTQSESYSKKRDEELDRMTIEKNNATMQLQQMSDNLIVTQKDYESKIEILQKREKELSDSMTNLTSENEAMKRTIHKLESEFKKFTSRNHQFQEEFEELRITMASKEKEITQFTAENHALLAEKEIQKSQLSEYNVRIKKLKREILILKNSMSKLSQELENERNVQLRILDEEMRSYSKRSLVRKLLLKEKHASVKNNAIPLETAPSMEVQQQKLAKRECATRVVTKEITKKQDEHGISEARKRRSFTCPPEKIAKTDNHKRNKDDDSSSAAERHGPNRGRGRPKVKDQQKRRHVDLRPASGNSSRIENTGTNKNGRSHSSGCSRQKEREAPEDERQRIVISIPKTSIKFKEIRPNLRRK